MEYHGDSARQLFVSHFGSEPDLVVFAPGRINLIGEHTDYSQGFVVPAAIEKGIWVAARKRDSGSTHLISSELGTCEPFDCRSLHPGKQTDWGQYPAGTAWALQESHHLKVSNIEAAVVSNLPMGAGISSSAALEVAFGLVWDFFAQSGLTKTQIALSGQFAENKFIGVNSGCMDQLASALGVKGRALFIDTRSLDTVPVQVPDSVVFVLCDTETSRTLAGSQYNDRRRSVEQACEWLGVPFLRDATLPMLAPLADEDTTVFECARHVVSENQRCLQFRQALEDNNLKLAGELMNRTHGSLRDHFKVSSPALNAMAEAAKNSKGCFGARMMGGGFGGACIAMVEKEFVNDFIAKTSKLYSGKCHTKGVFTVCELSAGAHVLA